ncbi:MAG: TrpR-like protein YerC/YecD [Oscillospiraceae bacterium]|nr:TrpR-like protein YerC/YecD [Oscillospiraceae bacterium]
MIDEKYFDVLCKAFAALETEEDIHKFLEDLCTPQEIDAMSRRLMVAVMLKRGDVYTKIVEATGASTATISRVNKTLTYQSAGGYNIILDKLTGELK